MKKIPLTQGKFALVDDADYEWLSQWKWCVVKDWRTDRWYAARHGQRYLSMHRVIFDAKHGEEVDHWNGDGLNNQRFNLRRCTHAQNTANRKRHRNNTSGYKGVHFHIRKQRWQARIVSNYRTLHLGYFATAREAAQAYDLAAKEAFGEFSRPNFT